MLTPLELSQRRNRINDLILDVVCDTTLTQGETLTILNYVKLFLDKQVKDLEESIKERTK